MIHHLLSKIKLDAAFESSPILTNFAFIVRLPAPEFLLPPDWNLYPRPPLMSSTILTTFSCCNILSVFSFCYGSEVVLLFPDENFVTAESVLSIWCIIGVEVVLLLTFCRSRHRDSLIHRLLCCSEIDTKFIFLFDFCTDQGIETSVGHSVADHVEVCEQAHNTDIRIMRIFRIARGKKPSPRPNTTQQAYLFNHLFVL